MRYYYRILKIKLRMYKRMVCVTIAGRLCKIAYWISPDFWKEYDKTVIRKHNAHIMGWDEEC